MAKSQVDNSSRGSLERILFVESVDQTETYFTKGLRQGATQSGAICEVIFLRDSKKQLKAEDQILKETVDYDPDLIVFIMDSPLCFPNLWKRMDKLRNIPKWSFWYDDFMRSPLTLESPDTWNDWQKNYHVTCFIWDGYWRQKWQEFTGHQALATHLAASPTQFNPQASPLYPELKEFAVMTGTIPSQINLRDEAEALPVTIRRCLQETIETLSCEPWPIRPYETFNQVILNSSMKSQTVTQAWLLEPHHQYSLNQLLWQWSKRIVRLRGLSAASDIGPVAVLSGHHLQSYACEQEIRSALPRNAEFKFYDTTDISSHDWSALYRSGLIQLQFTDPQSIQGGIPFRVFECAASQAPLITDSRPELALLFPERSSIYLCQDENDLCQKLSTNEWKDCPSTQLTYQNFLDNHTWVKRWQQLLRTYLIHLIGGENEHSTHSIRQLSQSSSNRADFNGEE